MATRSTGKYLTGRLEEAAVEVRALGQDIVATTGRLRARTGRLRAYDESENGRHLALRTADERAEDLLEQQLVAGDAWEAAQLHRQTLELERLESRALAVAAVGYSLAGDIRKVLEVRAQQELFPQERAT